MKYSVFIGRYQPVHKGHLRVITECLKMSDHLIIAIGSHRAPKYLNNPWTCREREDLIRSTLSKEENKRVTMVYVRDYLYDNNIKWLTSVQNEVSRITGGNSVTLVGHLKDDTSFYLKQFPQWDLTTVPYFFKADSTKIREAMYEGDLSSVEDIILNKQHLEQYMATERFQELSREYQFNQRYKDKWKNAPYAPIFSTTDAVVVKSGHVLLIKRGRNPGKGKYALPGGFVSQTQTIEDSCLRELKEETNIVFPKNDLRKCLKSSRVFDHPYRDPRGRTITHAFYYHIETLGPLPTVKAGDDAGEALWVPLSDLALLEEEFFSDHLHIINSFIHS